MNIVVNEELKAYIDPMTPEEHEALERSILAEGCRDALVLWGDVLVDGHNRYGICQKHDLPFKTVQNTRFKTIEDVHLWMIDQHLGRRSISDFLRGVLALRKKDIVDKQRSRVAAEPASASDAPFDVDPPADGSPDDGVSAASTLPPPAPLSSREAIAKAARLSSSQVVMIEKIQKQAAPELVAAIKSGTISINAAAAVSTLPAEEQIAAANGGKDELKQAAKRVREAKRPVRAAAATAEASDEPDDVQRLTQRVAELTAENEDLRRQVSSLHALLAAEA
jgi:hypothetical protein